MILAPVVVVKNIKSVVVQNRFVADCSNNRSIIQYLIIRSGAIVK
jgi:hypothetical protein